MNKLLLAFCLTLISSVGVLSQNSDDYKKAEFYVGYSNNQVDIAGNTGVRSFFGDHYNFNGFEASAVFNVSRYIGLKADFSGTYRNTNFSQTLTNSPITGVTTNLNFKARDSFYDVLGGVQFKDNSSEARVKPFAHVLAGAGISQIKVKDLSCTSTSATTNCSTLAFSDSDTGLAAAFGGGLDLKLSQRVDLRLIQVDYNPVRRDSRIHHNFRFGIGLNFK